jgi:hypothetical protein
MDYLTLTLQGDHYTQGWQHGRQVGDLRPQIAQAIELRFAQIEREGAGARFEQLLQETRDLLQEIDAPLLDLIRGQAKALEFEFETLLRYGLVTYLRDDLVIRTYQGAPAPPAGGPGDTLRGAGELGGTGCTTWAACGSSMASGQPLLAKNRDQTPEFLPLEIVAYVTPMSGYRYSCSGSAGCPGVFCAGINEAGLAVADSHVTSTDLGPGLPDYSLMMHLLEAHDRVSSALDYLRSVPRMGRNNLILADAQGHLAVFEIGHRSYGLSETSDGVLVSTNHFATPALRHHFVDTQEPPLRGNSFHRYQVVARALERTMGRIDVPFAQRLMATHAGTLDSLCRHPSAYSKVSTISTIIFLPVQRIMLYCNGLPCQNRYDEYKL